MATKSMFEQVQSLGGEALGKLTQNPAAAKLLQSANDLRERVDDLGKRVRGLEGLEQRLTEVEQRLDKLERAGARSGTKKTSPSAVKKTSAPPSD